jgi:hypothetical protein
VNSITSIHTLETSWPITSTEMATPRPTLCVIVTSSGTTIASMSTA